MDQNWLRGLPYKEYRHPTFEKFVNILDCVLEGAIFTCALINLYEHIGALLSFLILMLIFFVRRMKSNSIYFCDNKGIGPKVLTVLIEDIALSLRSSLVYFGVFFILKLCLT